MALRRDYILQVNYARSITTLAVATSAVVSGGLSSRYSWHVTYKRSSPAANAQLGKNLARLRNSIGLSQADMAERLGISLRHFQRVESGKSAPSIPLLTDLHKIFKTTWDDLFTGL